MSSDPTNVTRLEAELYKHGFRDDGFVTQLHPDANDEGRKWYPEVLTMGFDAKDNDNDAVFDFWDRYSEKAVRMTGYVHANRLRALCEALEANHRGKNIIHIEAIVSVRTAVAVCEAMRDAHGC